MRVILRIVCLAVLCAVPASAQTGLVSGSVTLPAGTHTATLCAVPEAPTTCSSAATVTLATEGPVTFTADYTANTTPPTGFVFRAGALAFPVPLSAWAAAPLPQVGGLPTGATHCATEGGACQWADGTARTIYYGNNGTWITRLSGSPAACTNAAFGSDPLPGALKECYLGPATATPAPVDAVVSAWTLQSAGAWSACVNGQQTRTETWGRTVLQPAQNGGTTPALSETRTGTQACAWAPPAVVVASTGCRIELPAFTTGPDGLAVGWTAQVLRNGANHGTADSGSPYGPKGANVGLGTYAMSLRMSKSGQQTQTLDLGTYVCDAAGWRRQ